jgi:hypothetical protein
LGPPPAPTFGVEASALDPTVAEVAGLAFATAVNTHSISGATFAFYYVDPAAAVAHLTARIGSGAPSIQLDSVAGIVAGSYLQIGTEVVLCGAPSGLVAPITRGQCGTLATGAGVGATVATVAQVRATAGFAGDFFNADPNAPTWHMEQPLPNMKLVSVGGYVSNVYGQSPVTFVALAGGGLLLTAPAGAGITTVNVTNQDTAIPTGNVLVNLTATTRTCTLTLPTESGDEGNQVSVKLSSGSTYNGIIAPFSGDTIDAAGASITITPAAPVWTGIAN